MSEGDRIAIKDLEDRMVSIAYGIEHAGTQRLNAMCDVSTKAFSEAYSIIRNDSSDYSPLIKLWNGFKTDAQEILEEHVHQLASDAIKWAKIQDLDQALQQHASLPTDAPGTGPILHLTSLALLGEKEKLKFYQASFEAGDRLGFVPYIKKDFIDRAVNLVEEYSKE